MRKARSPRFALALCITAALAACGSSESDVPADTSAVDANSAEDGSTSEADASTPDAAEDAGDGSDAFDPNLCYLGDDTEPSVLWIGAANLGPCDDPCYETVDGATWNDEGGCWVTSRPIVCLRFQTAATEPSCHQIDGVGIVGLPNIYPGVAELYPTVPCPTPESGDVWECE